MRTTKQIDALAESVRSKNDGLLAEDDKSLRAIPEREGKIPKIVHLENAAAEQKYVIDLIKRYLESKPNLTIGIIAAKNKQIRIYSDWLTSANIPHEQVTKDATFSMAKPGVKVVSAYGAKGLEFNCVIIPMFAEGYFPFRFSSDDEEEMEQFLIKMRNLVYVSMTRAKNLLTLTFWGKGGSRFIADMDKSLYEWVGDPVEIKPPKPIVPARKPENKPLVSVKTESKVEVVEERKEPGKEGEAASNLVVFLQGKGLEVIDKRSKGGALWVVGDKSIDPILKESRKEFGALWTFSEKGGAATKHKSGWFTKSVK